MVNDFSGHFVMQVGGSKDYILWESAVFAVYLVYLGYRIAIMWLCFRSQIVFALVIPFSRGSAWEQPPPDLASYLYKNRIVYLGMSLVPSVTELILAEFLYLQYEDEEKPIYLYINSTGTTKIRNMYEELSWSNSPCGCLCVFVLVKMLVDLTGSVRAILVHCCKQLGKLFLAYNRWSGMVEKIFSVLVNWSGSGSYLLAIACEPVGSCLSPVRWSRVVEEKCSLCSKLEMVNLKPALHGTGWLYKGGSQSESSGRALDGFPVRLGGEKLGYETEAFAIYDVMRYVKPPIFTLCVGNAWGEAALLLAAGAKGNRSALPSSTIMMKQPIARFQGQATDVELMRKEVRNVKAELVKLYAKHIGKSPEEIEADIRRPKYFSPSEAVEYGIIDKVLYNERSSEDRGVISNLKKAQLI
ncbi:hypothetical protein BUALT_Bualt05G0077900 [Buddleja alternifolia]|uniref:ATP-dependent Clp protease proteolytic subunit n=1 Tax=Buddleja alternifolia TaxID=168488 RepID=A0AAV6XQA2_9LAMI|nr:hypothetical protein BUALT_Bualt05G0077900 [Buddleja alternifolia]